MLAASAAVTAAVHAGSGCVSRGLCCSAQACQNAPGVAKSGNILASGMPTHCCMHVMLEITPRLLGFPPELAYLAVLLSARITSSSRLLLAFSKPFQSCKAQSIAVKPPGNLHDMPRANDVCSMHCNQCPYTVMVRPVLTNCCADL